MLLLQCFHEVEVLVTRGLLMPAPCPELDTPVPSYQVLENTQDLLTKNQLQTLMQPKIILQAYDSTGGCFTKILRNFPKIYLRSFT